LAPAEVWLAGGIRPDNAVEALEQVRPAGLDVASGAELPDAERGEKSREAIDALVAICHSRGGQGADSKITP
jgi:phosphoribosylanthranilate isomerase